MFGSRAGFVTCVKSGQEQYTGNDYINSDQSVAYDGQELR
jgi:hypothetical protein